MSAASSETSVAARERERRAAGLCPRCPAKVEAKPVEPGKTACRDCLDQARAIQKRRYDALKAEGACRTCMQPVAPDSATYCAEHAVKVRIEQRARQQRNLCHRCRRNPKAPGAGERYCPKCKAQAQAERRERARARRADDYRQAKAAGLCIRCLKRPAAAGTGRCDQCLNYARENQRLHRPQNPGRTQAKLPATISVAPAAT